MHVPGPEPEPVVDFGRHRLLATSKRLLRDGRPVAIGNRALGVLTVLIELRGRAVTGRELIERLWSGKAVGENALQAQIVAVRRALGDDRDLVLTVSGRGYQFIGEVREFVAGADSEAAHAEPGVIGRDRDIDALQALLAQSRLVTIVGAGGVGKSRVARSVAARLALQFAGGTGFVDLSELATESAVSIALGPANDGRGNEPAGADAANAPRLLVLDGCERWMDRAAAFAERSLRERPALRVLASSREPLRAEGESIHRLASFALPGEASFDEALANGADAVTVFAAMHEVAGATGDSGPAAFDASQRICIALDGLPLALAIASNRAALVGLLEVADELTQDATAPLRWRADDEPAPRHRCLADSIAWSVDSLPEPERRLLHCVARLGADDGFDIAQACAALSSDEVDSSGGLDRDDVLDALSALVARSLAHVTLAPSAPRWRLPRLVRSHMAMQPPVRTPATVLKRPDLS